MEGEIIFSVFILIFYAAADFYVEFRGYGHVTMVEEPVQIAAKKEAVVDRMGAALGIWFDVGGF